ncbi:MAG TPA: Ig-like domain-containing protein, partial [Acidimicrobiales bacterium]|nr:Ig-like domain-containing protein [Acidimicrobiales bacterium]
PLNVPSDGKTASTVTVTIEDHFGNPVAGQTISLAAASGKSTITPVQPTTDTSGKATFSVTDATTEIVTYTATDVTFGSTPLADDGVAVTFGTPPPPVPAVADSVVVAGAKTAPADGTSSVTITVLLYDANGDPVTGKQVSLNPASGGSMVTTVTGTTDADGQATFTVTDKTAETVTYAATDVTDSLPITGQSVAVQFTANTASPSTTTTSSAGATSASGTSTSGTTGSGGSGSSGSDATTADAGGSDVSTAADGSSGTGATLADTGTPVLLPWLLALGLLLLVGGSVGRRVGRPVARGRA